MWRILLAHFTPRPRAVRLTTDQHLRALTELPRADVLVYNAVYGLPSWLRHLEFDAVVLHTTLLGVRWTPGFDRWKRRLAWLGQMDTLKIALPQDEYSYSAVLDDWLDELGVSVVGTVLDDRYRRDLYPRLGERAAFYDVLTGYIDDTSAESVRERLVTPRDRAYDIVYRARNLPYWLGSHGQLKHRIGEVVATHAPEHGLTTDISTRSHETVLGEAWLEFMGSGRTTVGAESGSSALDRRGELQAEVEELAATDASLTFADVDARMPPGWDDYEFFAISPRHLEAVVTKTAQVLVEGSYSGVLEPGRHYIPVARNLSNLDEALEQVKDPQLLERMVERAYEDIYLSGRYSVRRLTETLVRILETHATPRSSGRASVFPLAVRLAGVEEEVERIAVWPLANALRVTRTTHREMLAGLRALATDAAVRRLLLDYVGSSETREHVTPQAALADLLCLSAARRTRAFNVSVQVEQAERRMLLTSHENARTEGPSSTELEQLLTSSAWEFAWDHSRLGESVEVPAVPRRPVRIDLAGGPRTLTVLNWLARNHPHDVAAALTFATRRD